MSFVRRLINIQFDLASGTFQNTTASSTTLSKLRTRVRISKAGTVAPPAQVQVYGMTLSDMNRLSTLGMRIQLIPRNKITIMAGDEGGALSTVFSGIIANAWGDFSAQPDVAFHVEATGGLDVNTMNTAATGYSGGTDVAQAMQQLAGKAGLQLENNGVNQQISKPYLWGSVGSQINQLAKAANISAFIDNGTLVIVPSNSARNGDPIEVSPQTGMIGYPMFTAQGIYVESLFNPAIKYYGNINVKSSLQPASGKWTVIGLDYFLDSLAPGGEWKMGMQCFNLAYGPPPLV